MLLTVVVDVWSVVAEDRSAVVEALVAALVSVKVVAALVVELVVVSYLI